MNYNRWDIVLVSFPFTDLTTTKKRPALIISNENLKYTDDYIIAFITSNIYTYNKQTDIIIKNWEQSGLPIQSLIRIKFATINKSLIIKTIGELSESDKINFIELFKNHFNF